MQSESYSDYIEARALGAHARRLGQPGRPPGWFGSVLGSPGWELGTGLAYTVQSVQNRAQSVKAKLHTWCNPMETSLNMNPSPNRFYIAYKHPLDLVYTPGMAKIV